MSINQSFLRAFAGGMALCVMTVFGPASAQDIYTSGHGDIGVGYDDVAEEFEPHWHMHAGAVVNGVSLGADEEYEPADLIARTSATRLSPTGSSGILGLADGSSIWVLGSSTYQPNLGFGVEELDPFDWIGNITVTFNPGLSTMPSGSADFALYTTNLSGTNTVDRLFSTSNPAATDFGNSFQMTPGDHMHFQWGLTELGAYDLSFTWSGTHGLDGAISTTANFTVQAVPEPSTIAMLGIAGGAGMIAVVRRRMRRSVSPIRA